MLIKWVVLVHDYFPGVIRDVLDVMPPPYTPINQTEDARPCAGVAVKVVALPNLPERLASHSCARLCILAQVPDRRSEAKCSTTSSASQRAALRAREPIGYRAITLSIESVSVPAPDCHYRLVSHCRDNGTRQRSIGALMGGQLDLDALAECHKSNDEGLCVTCSGDVIFVESRNSLRASRVYRCAEGAKTALQRVKTDAPRYLLALLCFGLSALLSLVRFGPRPVFGFARLGLCTLYVYPLTTTTLYPGVVRLLVDARAPLAMDLFQLRVHQILPAAWAARSFS
jgi:hypothetical protein